MYKRLIVLSILLLFPFLVAQSDVQGQILVPSTATASVDGRISTSTGRGIYNARISIADASGIVKTSVTNPFGFYRFEKMATGRTYAVTVFSKRYEFAENTRVLTINDNVTNFDFVAVP